MGAETLIALVYRAEKPGCRQYPFHSIEDLKKFCARKPYRDELLLVIVIKDRRELNRRTMAADMVVEFVELELRAA